MTVELDVKLKKNDYFRAVLWNAYWSSPAKKLSSILLVPYVAIFIPALAWYLMPDSRLLSFLGFASVFLLLVALSYYRRIKRQFTTRRDLQETIHYTFNAEGIQEQSPSSISQTRWTNLYRAVETGHSFLLYIGENQMYVIPKRCFSNGEHINSFKNLLQVCVPSQANLKLLEG